MSEVHATTLCAGEAQEVEVTRLGDEEESYQNKDSDEENRGEAERRDSRVHIAPGKPTVISNEGGHEWSLQSKLKKGEIEADCPSPELDVDSDCLPSSSSSDDEYELEEELRPSDEENIDISDARALRRLTNENTRRNSIPLAQCADSEDDLVDDAPKEPSYSQYDNSGAKPDAVPPYHVLEDVSHTSQNTSTPPYQVVDVPHAVESKLVPPYHVVDVPQTPDAAVEPYQEVDPPHPADLPKKRPPPRPLPPSDLSRRSHLPPVPSSPPPPTPNSNRVAPQRNGAIAVPPPPTTPPPPTPSSRTKCTPAPPPVPNPPVLPPQPAPGAQDGSGQLPKILYEEKGTVRHPDMVPIMYATPSALLTTPPPPPPPPAAHGNDPKRNSSFLNKMGKGMKQLKRRLTSPEAPEAPTSTGRSTGALQGAGRSVRNGGGHHGRHHRRERTGTSTEDKEAMEERRRGGIQTQKNVKPPKPPPPSRLTDGASIPKPKPRLLGGLKDKIVDLEDISCLDALFPFLFSVSRLHANEAPGVDTLPPALLDSCARAFLAAWTRKWRRRAERDEARGTPGGAFHLGECPLFDGRHPVFEAHLLGEKLVALPPSQVSVAAHELLPPSLSPAWRTPQSTGLAVVAVRCCIPVERLLSQLGPTEDPISPLRRHLSLAVLVLLLACNLPASVAPSQVMVLLARHDIRFLVADTGVPEPPPPPPGPHASLLQRLAPHLAPANSTESDLEVAVKALMGSLLPGVSDRAEWRRLMAPQLLPRLFQPFADNDLFAPLLMSLLLEEGGAESGRVG